MNVKIDDGQVLISFPDMLLSKEYIIDFLERIRLEEIALKSNLSEENANKLSEIIDSEWWQQNGSALLARIKSASSNS